MRITRVAFAVPAALLFLCGICGSPPNVPETPWGAAQGMKGLPFPCTTRTTDPAGGQVAYRFDWGDGNRSDWSGFVDDGLPYADTHSYQAAGPYGIKAQAKNSKRASAWSEAFNIYVNPGEGAVRWSFAYTPESPDDSADFSLNTFGIAPDGNVYIGCDYALVARRSIGTRRWEFYPPDFDEFYPAPTIGDDGTVYIGCLNDTLYAVNPDGTRKWTFYTADEVVATAALGQDGTVYVQTEGDSVVAVWPDGNRRWAFYSGGGRSSPAVGTDGTVYVANQEGVLYALDPGAGTPKWNYPLADQPISASPAIDTSRNCIYIVDEEGNLASVDLEDGSWIWDIDLPQPGEPSSPVVGEDGTVYVGAGGKLIALNPASGGTSWMFDPPLEGFVSTPAVSATGYVYVLVTQGKRDVQSDPDSLYGLNPDGQQRWACALGEGYSDEIFSSPKLDQDGNIYIGNGLAAWCVGGIDGPARSSWPMFQADARNTGRAGSQ